MEDEKKRWKGSDDGKGVLMEGEDKRKVQWSERKERMMGEAGWRVRREDGRGRMMGRKY